MQKNKQLFPTPFSGEYWRLSAAEFRNWKMLVLAAMLTAMRIAIKSLFIPVGPSLKITFGFLINAVGSMIYGPVVAIAASAISSTVLWERLPAGSEHSRRPDICRAISSGMQPKALFSSQP